MFTKTRLVTFVFVIGLMLTVVGCSANQSTASITVFPIATFKAQSPGGEFTLEFKADGTFAVTGTAPSHDVTATAQKSTGTYTVSQNQVIIKGSYCDSGDNASGTYTWRFDGSLLTLTSSDDKCNDRWRIMNLAWLKQ